MNALITFFKNLFSTQPATVAGVFESAVADIRVIQDNQVAIQKQLKEEQAESVAVLDAENERLAKEKAAVEATFKEKSKANKTAAAAAEKERMAAGRVIGKFAEMFEQPKK